MTEKEIYELIENEGVEFIRLQFTDIFGRLKNIAVTPGQMEKVFANRYTFDGDAAFGHRYSFEEKLYLYPDRDTFMILPWRPQQGKVAKIICDIRHKDGTPFECCSRNILRTTLNAVADKGYMLMVDPECEFFLFHTDENGLPTTTTHEKAGYMDVGPSDFGENARRDIVLMLEEMGFEIESSHHESAPAQHEIELKESEAMKMADSIMTFRFAVRSIAKRFGLYATFMPKPKNGIPGSGMHTNFTLIKDGKNVFKNDDGTVSKEAMYFIGGVLKHSKALAAIANPTVNSYKRLIEGYDQKDTYLWAESGESALVKLNNDIDDIKVELRFPDGSSNPYLLFATALVAGLDGIEQRIEPGSKNILSVDEDGLLPNNLKDALNELSKDNTLISSLGEDFSKIFITIKNNEWRDFMREVSDWELDRYLSRI
ncbi:MAG: glutamine synthetase family protein [Lachnospiraceae bacterium]|nr:glutamine synthetase family protein [Lachnospiraceae bacterium]